jgi:ATP-dependent protease ClpP protease subunit
MAWNGNNESLGPHSPLNFFYDGYVFLNDVLSTETCAYLIADITRFILDSTNSNKNLTFIINSPGGSSFILNQISGLLSLAKLKGLSITTFVLGQAGSAASLIAVQGDIRGISKDSSHFVHFGTVTNIIQKDSELDKYHIQNKDYRNRINNVYLNNCRGLLTKKKLFEIQEDECGTLTAEQCIEYGLCDFIIENDLEEKFKLEKAMQDFAEKHEQKNKKGNN